MAEKCIRRQDAGCGFRGKRLRMERLEVVPGYLRFSEVKSFSPTFASQHSLTHSGCETVCEYFPGETEMAWYAYCITEQQGLLPGSVRARRPVAIENLRGVNDAPVFACPSGEFAVIVSEHSDLHYRAAGPASR